VAPFKSTPSLSRTSCQRRPTRSGSLRTTSTESPHPAHQKRRWGIYSTVMLNFPFHCLPSGSNRARICKPFKEPRNRFPAWRNRFLGSFNVYNCGLNTCGKLSSFFCSSSSFQQCFGSVTFWDISGSGSLDPALFVSDFKDAIKKLDFC
jgi:hypothetical protein